MWLMSFTKASFQKSNHGNRNLLNPQLQSSSYDSRCKVQSTFNIRTLDFSSTHQQPGDSGSMSGSFFEED